MWVHTIDPVLVRFGPVEIRWYGLVFALGVVLAFVFMDWYRKRGLFDIEKEKLYDLILWITIGVVIGARVFTIVFYEPGYYFSNPLKMVALWEGGLSIHGGLVGGFVAAWLFCRRRGVDFWRAADLIAAPVILGLAFGRIANFINGELWGTASSAAWCVNFKNTGGGDVCRHPWQLYAAAQRFMIFGYTMLIGWKAWTKGFVFWNMVFLETAGRFVFDFLREERLHPLGLTVGQWLSAMMLVIALYLFATKYKDDWKNLFRRRTRSPEGGIE